MKFGGKNGCTIVVPGSHRKNTYVQNINKHKKKYIELKSGDILIYDGRLWHSAGSNKTDGTRWMFIFGFARWHLRQTYDFTRNISKKLLKTFKKKEILKLGFHAITKFDEKSSSFGWAFKGSAAFSVISCEIHEITRPAFAKTHLAGEFKGLGDVRNRWKIDEIAPSRQEGLLAVFLRRNRR